MSYAEDTTIIADETRPTDDARQCYIVKGEGEWDREIIWALDRELAIRIAKGSRGMRNPVSARLV